MIILKFLVFLHLKTRAILLRNKSYFVRLMFYGRRAKEWDLKDKIENAVVCHVLLGYIRNYGDINREYYSSKKPAKCVF